MKDAIVGYTGFVGGNLCTRHTFEGLFNSKNIAEAFGTRPELLIYAGIRAEMYLANKFPEKDFAAMREAIENIRKINPQRLVLISTISVYDNLVGIDERAEINESRLTAYGRNRRYLEKEIRRLHDNALIVRLPALYGLGIKKNFIFDMIHFVPSMLNERKYLELARRSELIRASYKWQENGFYKCEADSETKGRLKQCFEEAGFSALNFTDSRSQFQFYNLAYLWEHLKTALAADIRVLNLATEPVAVTELSRHVLGKTLQNEIRDDYPLQDYRSLYASKFGGRDGYLFDKAFVLNDIKDFIESQQS